MAVMILVSQGRFSVKSGLVVSTDMEEELLIVITGGR